MRKIHKNTVSIVLATALLVGCGDNSEQANKEKIAMQEAILVAADSRNSKNQGLLDALNGPDSSLNVAALMALGHIGDESAVINIRSKLRHESPDVRAAAAIAAGYTKNDSLMINLRGALSIEDKDAVIAALYRGIGFLIKQEDLQLFTDAFNAEINDTRLDGLLNGMVTAIGYMRVNAADMEGFDFAKLLDIIMSDGPMSVVAANLLTYMGQPKDVMSGEAIQMAYEGATDNEVKTYLLRVLRRYEDTPSSIFVEAAESINVNVALAGVRGLKSREDEEAGDALLKIMMGADNILKVTALAEAGSLDDPVANPELNDVYRHAVRSPSDWVASTALLWLARNDREQAIYMANQWWDGDNEHLKRRSIPVLMLDEEGKKRVEIAANNTENMHIYYAVRSALGLDNADEDDDTPLANTVPAAEALAATDKYLKFNTTRGVIVVDLLAEAPYVSHNFVNLAEAGGFNNMLFHRVIGNFVAQAGERTDTQFKNWPMIREEWSPNVSHEIGTIGVATRGKDTGTLQFFFNIEHNRRLDGRYSVFARVVDGLDVMMALEMGDVIESVEVLDSL